MNRRVLTHVLSNIVRYVKYATMFMCLSVSLPASGQPDQSGLTDLGQALFFDRNLSRTRNQSCADCHNPQTAFIDRRPSAARGAVSLGDDGHSFGTRNTPSLTYVSMVPAFHFAGDGAPRGGLFYDGRALDLVKQAEGPLLNPKEMNLADAYMLRQRIIANKDYVQRFTRLFGAATVEDARQLLTAAATALTAFQSTRTFNAFDSRYDRHLKGEYVLTDDEETGRALFFSDLLNCNGCHRLNRSSQAEAFTDYSYHNIGVPDNPVIRQLNASPPTWRDVGLADNPSVDASTAIGKFRVPSLRNVAVSAPYMHNGVFAELDTVLRFYNRYLIRDTLNPETGQPWREAEVPDNLSMELLRRGQPLSEMHIRALRAFLFALTDRQFEHLLPRESGLQNPAG